MTRDCGVIRFQKGRYNTDRCFSKRMDSSMSFGEYYTCVDTAHICCHAVRAVYVCVCCWVLSHVD